MTNIVTLDKVNELHLMVYYDNKMLLENSQKYRYMEDNLVKENFIKIFRFCKKYKLIFETFNNEVKELENIIENPNIKNEEEIYNFIKNDINIYKNNIISFQQDIFFTMQNISRVQDSYKYLYLK